MPLRALQLDLAQHAKRKQILSAQIFDGLEAENSLAIERSKEHRDFGRRPSFKAAVAVLDDGRRIAGILLDQSESDAKIKLQEPSLLKGELFLEVPDDDLVVRCRVAGVEGGVTAFEYVKPPRRLSWLQK